MFSSISDLPYLGILEHRIKVKLERLVCFATPDLNSGLRLIAMTIGDVFLCRCEDPDLSGDVAISGVIRYKTWRLLRYARNDRLDILPNDMYFTLGRLEHGL
jgi:hypothetical protein